MNWLRRLWRWWTAPPAPAWMSESWRKQQGYREGHEHDHGGEQ